MPERQLAYVDAILEGERQMLAEFPELVLMGLGVPDPGGVFGSTKGLHLEFPGRVFDLPLSEEANAGVAHGMALTGMRVIQVHQRVDFLLLAMNQIVNHAAKWRWMFSSKKPFPVVYRSVIGRGWGQGAQHSQSLHALLAHVPGLLVALPATPYDAKGLLVEAVRRGAPAILLEHRNLYALEGDVPEAPYAVPFGSAAVRREGRHVTVAAVSQMVHEALKAAEALSAEGIEAEVLDLRSAAPLDEALLLRSVRKTGALLVCDTSWAHCGLSAEVAARAAEHAFDALKAPVARVTLPPSPTPSSPALEAAYYPGAAAVAAAARRILKRGGTPGVPSGPTGSGEKTERESW